MLTGFSLSVCLAGSDCFLVSMTGAPLLRVRPPTDAAAAAADDDDDDAGDCAARRVRPLAGTF